jgi:hypothetical protein
VIDREAVADLSPGLGIFSDARPHRRIKIVLVLPPSPEPCFGARLACEADIEGVPGARVWLRRTSREADLERRVS